MSCCVSPNWEAKQRGQGCGNGTKARMLGESDTASIPGQKQDTKHGVFVFPFTASGSTLLLLLQRCQKPALSQKEAAAAWQECGVRGEWVHGFSCLSLSLPASLFHMHSHTSMLGLTPSRRGEQTGRDRLSASEDSNDEQRNCQISRLSTAPTLFATGGVNTVLNSPKPQQHKSHGAAEDLCFHSFNLSKGDVQLTAHLDFTLLTSHLLENWTSVSFSVGKERPPRSSRLETDNNGGNVAQEQAGTGARRGCR